ncbi:unnamed protein product [Enterobius vermicularis]|uniref:Uncharacterized protein n=1 Tax=Enterobius vermicularis TaxID=51028 RepID=A0A0N4V5J9_ENTVE|nr:unnamed protein product [Enterobius vermicularis]
MSTGGGTNPTATAAAAAALEHFLTTKFRTVDESNDPCDYPPMNCNRDGTLTFRTFRPRDYSYNNNTRFLLCSIID